MMTSIDLAGFLVLGLIGGVGHCVGMCSPFVLFVSRRYARPGAGNAGAMVAQAWYTAGRLTTYALLGAVAGGLGSVVDLAGRLIGWQRAASAVAGGVLVAWSLAALIDVAGLSPGVSVFGRIAARLKGSAPGHPFVVGLFLGLLPCGLVYSAVIAAVATGSAVGGAAAVALFGLGTAPALLGLSIADALIGRDRALLNRLSQVFMLVMGAWFLWRAFA